MAVLLAAGLSAGCAVGSDHDDDHGGGALKLPPVANIAEGEPKPVADIGPGSCLNSTDAVDGQQHRRVLDCGSPHRFQVFSAAVVPRPAEQEKDRAWEGIAWCQRKLDEALPATGIDRKTLMTSSFDDYRPGDTQRTVVCAVGYTDLRQTSAAILPAETR